MAVGIFSSELWIAPQLSTTNTCQNEAFPVELGFPPETLQTLTGMGYTIKPEDRYWSDGECIAVDPKTGLIEGGQDKRHSFGKAAGY